MVEKMAARPAKSVKVGSHLTSEPILSPQGQKLIPTITQDFCGAKGLSACMVVMPPGKTSKAHLHKNNEIIVIVIEGYAATLIGPEMEPVFHGPGEFIFIPDGIIHAAVNLSTEHRLVAIEVRTDPKFNEDVVLTPEHEDKLKKVGARLHKHFAAGKLNLPKHWNVTEFGPFKFAEAGQPV